MKVAVSRNFGRLTDARLLTAADWKAIGSHARDRIVQRTTSGKDERDVPFAPYSPRYAKALAKAGASTRVDLQVSGEMLRAIEVQPDDTGVNLVIR